ncbi:MAG: hypothetical protein JWP81_2526 [Ferruginibacter sp.]|nr:hypothetical protein [Ferruginibacter sp.]
MGIAHNRITVVGGAFLNTKIIRKIAVECQTVSPALTADAVLNQARPKTWRIQ